jgi:transposase-like protein
VPSGWWLKYSPEFRAQALERLKSCDNVSRLARELKIPRRWLYLWRDRARTTVEVETAEDREREVCGSGCRVGATGRAAGRRDRLFQWYLAKSRGATPEERREWRRGI